MYREGRPRKNTFPVNLIVDGGAALVVGGGQVGRAGDEEQSREGDAAGQGVEQVVHRV